MKKAKKPIIELKDAWKIYTMGDVKVNALRGLNLKIFPLVNLNVNICVNWSKSTLKIIILSSCHLPQK